MVFLFCLGGVWGLLVGVIWKLLIVVFGLPFVVASFLGWVMGHRVLDGVGEVRVNLEGFLRRLMAVDGVEDKLTFRKGGGGVFDKLKRKEFVVDEGVRESQYAEDLGRVLSAYVTWKGGDEYGEALGWKLKVAKLVRVLPVFLTLIAVVGCLGRMPMIIGVAVIVIAWGGSALLAWSCLGVNRELARRAELLVTERRLLERISDEEAVVEAIRALPWCELAPFDVVKKKWRGNE